MANFIPKYMFTCEELVQHDDGTYSFEHVFDKRTLKKIPSEISFKIVIGFDYIVNKKGKNDFELIIIDPNNEKLDKTPNFNVDDDDNLDNMVSLVITIDAQDFSVDEEGFYTFYLRKDEKYVFGTRILFTEGKI